MVRRYTPSQIPKLFIYYILLFPHCENELVAAQEKSDFSFNFNCFSQRKAGKVYILISEGNSILWFLKHVSKYLEIWDKTTYTFVNFPRQMISTGSCRYLFACSNVFFGGGGVKLQTVLTGFPQKTRGRTSNNKNSFLCLISEHIPQMWLRWSTCYQTLWQKRRHNFAIIIFFSHLHSNIPFSFDFFVCLFGYGPYVELV